MTFGQNLMTCVPHSCAALTRTAMEDRHRLCPAMVITMRKAVLQHVAAAGTDPSEGLTVGVGKGRHAAPGTLEVLNCVAFTCHERGTEWASKCLRVAHTNLLFPHVRILLAIFRIYRTPVTHWPHHFGHVLAVMSCDDNLRRVVGPCHFAPHIQYSD